VGRCRKPRVPKLHGEWILDVLADNMYDSEGALPDHSWLDAVSHEKQGELEEVVNQVVNQWLEKHNLLPDWFVAEDAEMVEV
jgi:uncharacterized protein YggL (DUF469 family)